MKETAKRYPLQCQLFRLSDNVVIQQTKEKKQRCTARGRLKGPGISKSPTIIVHRSKEKCDSSFHAAKKPSCFARWVCVCVLCHVVIHNRFVKQSRSFRHDSRQCFKALSFCFHAPFFLSSSQRLQLQSSLIRCSAFLSLAFRDACIVCCLQSDRMSSKR